MSEGELKAARRLSKTLGGVEITMGIPELGKMSYFSDKLAPIEVEAANAKRKIAVEVSSVQQDNDTLLHYLFRKTVER